MATKKTTKRPAAKKAAKKSAAKAAKKSTTKKSATKKSATKKTAKKATKKATKKSTAKATKKRASKSAPAKATANKTSSQSAAPPSQKDTLPAKRRPVTPRKRPTTLSSGRANRPTQPEGPRAKRLDGELPAAPIAPGLDAKPLGEPPRPVVVPMPERPPRPSPAPAPEPTVGRASAPPSYLESVPEDHAQLVAGLFQVFRGVAKDLRTLFTQALVMSQKGNRRGR